MLNITITSERDATEVQNGLSSTHDKIKYIASHYGYDQNKIAIEEMSELTKSLCKIERYPAIDFRNEKYMDSVIEEIADVWIVIEQLRHLYGAADVDRVIEEKIERQLERIKSGME